MSSAEKMASNDQMEVVLQTLKEFGTNNSFSLTSKEQWNEHLLEGERRTMESHSTFTFGLSAVQAITEQLLKSLEEGQLSKQEPQGEKTTVERMVRF
jgi:hypothetical protein